MKDLQIARNSHSHAQLARQAAKRAPDVSSQINSLKTGWHFMKWVSILYPLQHISNLLDSLPNKTGGR